MGEQLCRELSLEMGDEPAESLWVKIRRPHNVCYGLPDQDEEVDEPFFQQLEVSHSPALDFMGNLNHIGICCLSNAVGRKQSRRFL